MSQEIELKLRLPAQAVSAFVQHPCLAGTQATQKRLLNTYYDTPDLRLRAQAIALRFRRSGDQWLLTVKGGNPSVGGLAARSEWETAATPGCFDFSHVDDPGLRALLEDCRDQLTPVFTTDFDRRAWRVTYQGAAIEVVLDTGHIEAAQRQAPIHEVEMELLGTSDPAPLFALALEMADGVPLHPEAASKAERGYALFLDRREPPCTADSTPITKDMDPREAFRALALTCLTQLQRNENGVATSDDPEYIHQSRVAIRRLRSALRLFAPQLPADFVATYGPPWKEVARVLGAPRDWDVFCTEILAKVPGDVLRTRARHALTDAATGARASALATARDALALPSYGRFLLGFMADVLALPATEPARPALARFARKRLRKRWNKIHQHLRDRGIDAPEERHALRIELKKLRYAMEFFAPLLPDRGTRVLQRKAIALQTLLGELNDLTNARAFIATQLHTLHAPRAMRALDDWLANRHGTAMKKVGRLLPTLAGGHPW